MSSLKLAPLIVTHGAIDLVSAELKDPAFLGRETIRCYATNRYLGEYISFIFGRDNDAPFMIGALVTHALLRIQAESNKVKIPWISERDLDVFFEETKNEIIWDYLDIERLNNRRLNRMQAEGNSVLAGYISDLTFNQSYSPTFTLGASNVYEVVMSALENERVPRVFKR